MNKIDKSIETEVLVDIKGDPHEFEPSSSEIKNFLNAKILITGPIELNPWIKKINYQRSKNSKLQTFNFSISEDLQKFYNSNNKEALSHFWLYPQIFCDFQKQLTTFNIFNKNKNYVSCNSKDIELEISEAFKKIKNPIVMTHDALYPLFKKYVAKNINIINLKGSGHHEEISPIIIKEIYKLSDPKIIWIIENNMAIPDALKNKIKNTDKKILIDTAKSSDTNDFSILKKLINGLN